MYGIMILNRNRLDLCNLQYSTLYEIQSSDWLTIVTIENVREQGYISTRIPITTLLHQVGHGILRLGSYFPLFHYRLLAVNNDM
jgi:hypothetical protein